MPDGKPISSEHFCSFNNCSSLACNDGSMKRVIRSAPMITGEFGPACVRYSTALDNSCPAVKSAPRFDATLLT